MRRRSTCCTLGFLILSSFLLCSTTQAQGTAAGSPQQPKHHFRLPIGLDRIPAEEREKMPLPFGIGVTFFGSNERYRFDSAAVSFNGQPIPPQMMILDSLKVEQDSSTIRLDAWILPFLNVYAIGGRFSGKTTDIRASMVGLSVPLPDEIPFKGTNKGFGAMLAAGYKSLFATYDWNISWARLDLADGHVATITQGVRVGVMSQKPNLRTDVYVGGFKEAVSGSTRGSITFAGIGQFDYDVAVTPESAWNYIIGANIELHKQWQISLEHGFGKRTHNMLSVTARF